ncbi:MAG: flagellar export protein FliJ [Fimbriiglobus sp.]|nr:flagellar export protein FliJ [Fimbriiglobus sp.]
MKKFEFHLDGLLRVKRQLEHLAELEQQKAQRRVADAVAKVAMLTDQLAKASDHIAGRVGQAMTAGEWAAAFARAERLGQMIADARQEVLAAEGLLDNARRERVQVATEVEAISTLRGQQWEQWRQEVAAADQERLDELGLRRWMAAQAGPRLEAA